MHGRLIFTPKSTDKTQSPQTQGKEMTEYTVTIPGFFKGWVDFLHFLPSSVNLLLKLFESLQNISHFVDNPNMLISLAFLKLNYTPPKLPCN